MGLYSPNGLGMWLGCVDPRISEFYGIVISLYFGDHDPPHFPAKYGGDKALFAIEPERIVRGWLPPRAQRMVLEWAALHREELSENWRRAQRGEPLIPIPPLV